MNNCYIFADTRTIADLTGMGDMVPGTMTITRINVPLGHRGKGLGSKILKAILDDADASGVSLSLEVLPSGGLNYDELVSWYERHGFQWHKSRMYMIRKI